jgi:hypothetical protein
MLTRCYGGGTMMVYCHANLAAIFRSGSIGALYARHSSGIALKLALHSSRPKASWLNVANRRGVHEGRGL